MGKLKQVMALSLLMAMSTNIYSYAGVVKNNAAKVVETSDPETFEQPTFGEDELYPAEETAVNETTVGADPSNGQNTSGSSQNSSGVIRRDTDSNYGPGMNLPGSKTQITMPDGVKATEFTLSQSNKYYQYVWRESGQEPQAKAYIFEPKNFNGKTVFLDAGHGDNSSQVVYQRNEKIYPLTDEELTAAGNWSKGYGVGAQARTSPNVYDNKEIEPEFALSIALMTRDILLSRGYKVVLSRTALDQNLSNGSRSALAGETSDIMISIHSNGSSSKTAHGTIAFYAGDNDYLSTKDYTGYTDLLGLGKHQQASKKLSDSLVNQLSAQVGFRNLGTAQAVLRLFSYSSIPTSLLEVGFSDNEIDAKLLIEKKPEIAKSIADGVDEYFR